MQPLLIICFSRCGIRANRLGIDGDPDGKIRRLLEYAGENSDVVDPWYSDRFDIAYRDISRGCEALLAVLKKEME